MQIFVLLLVMGLLIERDLGVAAWPALGTWWMLAASVGAYVVPMAMTWLGCVWTLRVSRRSPGRAYRAINRLHVLLMICRWLTLGIFLTSIFALGWMSWLHEHVGDWILVDELIALGPPVVALVFGWWAYYPIDRRLREAALIRQLDEGQPIFSFHTRGQYVGEQVRHQLLLVGVPLALILLWLEIVQRFIDRGQLPEDAEAWLTAVGAAGVFLFAPLIVRVIWSTIPMPSGELRQRLTELCRVHGVKVKQLLLWRTHTGLVNGAVVGLIGPLRYILLTDGLVQQLEEDRIEAVMAHELGHVRRHHMPWLAVCALGTLGAIFSGADAMIYLIAEFTNRPELRDLLYQVGGENGTLIDGIAVGVVLAAVVGLWAMLFGWISRRFERQADTFAVQHLSQHMSEAVDAPSANDPTLTPTLSLEGRGGKKPSPLPRHGGSSTSPKGRGGLRITTHAVETMAGALERVSQLNYSPASRHNWRHGSIDWRIGYLRTLVGGGIDDCSIDGTVKRICWGCALLLALSIAWQWWLGG